MNPEIGHFALILAFLASLCQFLFPVAEKIFSLRYPLSMPARFQILASICIFISFYSLVHAFVVSDFSVQLVTSHSHSLKPLIYKITGSWGNHEGSLLLWIVILALFGLGFVWREEAGKLKDLTLITLGLISSAFLAFSLFTSNPFKRLEPVPLDGRGLNPVLQDIGLALHPPTLYLGYVGLSLAFALAIAGLLHNKVDRHWASIAKFWVNIAWCALTAGIALGSWWAYYELGWGGWWFWDPVENASLMPWLAATALLHCVIVVEKREQMVSWTLLMAITAFSLSLVGTFIVRSGLLTSVHSFASDPARGVFILCIFLAAVGIPLALYAVKGGYISKTADFDIFSRETGLLINNYVLVVSTLIVLIGTFYPLGLELFTGAKITVGAPYFDATFNPVMAIGVIFMGIGPLLVWKKGWISSARTVMLCALFTILGAVVLFLFSGITSATALAGTLLVLWLTACILADMFLRLKPFKSGLGNRLRLPASQWGMWCAHSGVIVFLIGALSSHFLASETIIRAKPGAQIEMGQHTILFDRIEQRQGPNFVTETALLHLQDKTGQFVAELAPEKRFYPAERQTTTEAAIRPRLSGDYYAVLGDGDMDKGFTLRLYHKPFVSWIWAGVFLMALGGLIALYRRKPLPTQ